jgi:hypothetical protein
LPPNIELRLREFALNERIIAESLIDKKSASGRVAGNGEIAK